MFLSLPKPHFGLPNPDKWSWFPEYCLSFANKIIICTELSRYIYVYILFRPQWNRDHIAVLYTHGDSVIIQCRHTHSGEIGLRVDGIAEEPGERKEKGLISICAVSTTAYWAKYCISCGGFIYFEGVHDVLSAEEREQDIGESNQSTDLGAQRETGDKTQQ